MKFSRVLSRVPAELLKALAIAMKDGELTPAGRAFVQKQGVTVEAVTTVDTPKGAVLAVKKVEGGESTARLLADGLDAVVTVADAKWLSDRLKDAPEAKNQIAFADVIILNKLDLVTPEQLREVEGRIRAINPYAKLHRTQRSQIGLDQVLGRNAFDLDRILEIEPEFLKADDHDHHHDHDHDHGHHHHHDHGGMKHYHDEEMQSFSIKTEKPLDPNKFFPWVQKLVADEGPQILRTKGILSFKDDDDRFVFQGVHMILDGDHQRPWKKDETRDSRIVFIGRNLPEDKIREGFLNCVA